MLFVFFWVIPRRLIYIHRRFGTLSVPSSKAGVPLKMEQIECSETSAYINQTPGNHPKENKQHATLSLGIIWSVQSGKDYGIRYSNVYLIQNIYYISCLANNKNELSFFLFTNQIRGGLRLNISSMSKCAAILIDPFALILCAHFSKHHFIFK